MASTRAQSRPSPPGRSAAVHPGQKSLSPRQLLVYHFMFGPSVEGWPEAGCPGCSYTADSLDGAVVHLPTYGGCCGDTLAE